MGINVTVEENVHSLTLCYIQLSILYDIATEIPIHAKINSVCKTISVFIPRVSFFLHFFYFKANIC